MANPQVTEADILAALSRVQEPELRRDLVALNMIKELQVRDGSVTFNVQFANPAYPRKQEIADACRAAVAAVPGVSEVKVGLTSAVLSSMGAGTGLLPGVRTVIAVGSGKGGVGKSTVAANLATALQLDGARAGLLDADVYGPSIPTMMGAAQRARFDERSGKLVPIERYGVKLFSIGFLMDDPGAPVMWRGPMIARGVQQMMSDVDWGDLDYLIVDLPPGTGDIQLTLSQVISLTGAVIVMTAQDVAVNIATKALLFFRRLNVPILGIVENMSTFACPACGAVTPIFGRGGGEQRAAVMGAPFLGAVPLDPSIVEHSDEGVPTVVAAPESAQARAFREIARAVAERARTVPPSAGGPVAGSPGPKK